MCPIDDPAATMNRATNREVTVGICGAGIGGLVLALRLAKLGFRPVLFEARSKEAALSEGEFLTLASNGMNGLRTVDCYEEVLRQGLRPAPSNSATRAVKGSQSSTRATIWRHSARPPSLLSAAFSQAS